MNIELNRPFGSNSRVAETDVRVMKIALNRLGFYAPHPDAGINDIPDRPLFAALKNFQAARGLRATGEARPGDATMEALNQAVADQPPEATYVWQTMEDPRVRPSHAARDGLQFSMSDYPAPGDEEGCRCWMVDIREPKDQQTPTQKADPYPDRINPVYPDFDLIGLLGGEEAAQVFLNWLENQMSPASEPQTAQPLSLPKPQNEPQPKPLQQTPVQEKPPRPYDTWKLGDHKTPEKWGRQMEQRGWTKEKVTDTIKHGEQFPAPNNPKPENTATRYEYEGNYVVINDVTHDLIQVGEPDFIRPIIPER